MGRCRTKRSVDDNAVGVAAVGDAARVLVGEVVGEGEVRAELLEAGLALGAGAVGVDHAADCGEVAGLEFGYRGADLGDAADDLVAGDAGVDGGHHAAPLIAGLVEIGVTDAAEEDFDLNVVLGWIAPRDRSGGKRRSRAGSGIGFRLVHELPFDLNSGPVLRHKVRHAMILRRGPSHAPMPLSSARRDEWTSR